jgi:hypothetical protein
VSSWRQRYAPSGDAHGKHILQPRIGHREADERDSWPRERLVRCLISHTVPGRTQCMGASQFLASSLLRSQPLQRVNSSLHRQVCEIKTEPKETQAAAACIDTRCRVRHCGEAVLLRCTEARPGSRAAGAYSKQALPLKAICNTHTTSTFLDRQAGLDVPLPP